MTLAGGDARLDDVMMAFYGDIFRPPGTRSLSAPPMTAADLTDPLEGELLLAWWTEAARVDPAVPGPEATTRLRTPYLVQRALNALSGSRFFAGVAEHLLVGALSQVRRYLTEDAVRERVCERLAECLSEDTRLVVAHSLGSVVAYETLNQLSEPPHLTLITLGSPLAIPNLIFDRLRPAPRAGVGSWPPVVREWINIADHGDIVALVKALAPFFPGDLSDVAVHNGAKAHDVRPYLTARETGAAVCSALPAQA